MNHHSPRNGYTYAFVPPIISLPQAQTSPRSNATASSSPSPQCSLLTTQQAADYLGLKKGTLINWRCTKKEGIPYIKVGGRVSYLLKDLDTWLQKKRVVPQDWNND